MKIAYRNDTLEQVLTGIKAVTSLVIVAAFALLFGFYEPPLPRSLLIGVLSAALTIFVVGKTVRLFNAESKREYLLANWYEIPMLIVLAVVVSGAGRWFGRADPGRLRHEAIAIYLVFDVTIKFFMTSVHLAAAGRNPTRTWVGGFIAAASNSSAAR